MIMWVLPAGNGSFMYCFGITNVVSQLQPFYDANKAIWAWQNANGGCPSSSCAFIQFHGKSPKTCPYDQMFLSSGLGG